MRVDSGHWSKPEVVICFNRRFILSLILLEILWTSRMVGVAIRWTDGLSLAAQLNLMRRKPGAVHGQVYLDKGGL